ncbi:calcium ion binding [Sparganum proliferum]
MQPLDTTSVSRLVLPLPVSIFVDGKEVPFLRLQPDPSGHLSGLQAKAFFELSKLPIHDLSSIWELSDVDCDGKLSLSEFCVAMHLVVLRRNNVLLPKHLPQTLRREATSSALSAVNLPRRSPPDQPAPPSPPGRQVNATCSVTDGPASVLDPPRTVPRLVLSEHHSLDSAPPTDPCARCSDTDSLAVRQRRWSASSQSDVVSLTENAVPSFDGRLAPNAQLHHPIPIRAGAPLASFQSPPPIRHLNTTRPLDLPGRPLAGVPSDSANAIPDHPAPPPPPAPAPQPRPPTPPPRARTLGATGLPVLGPPRNSSGPSLPNPLTDDLPSTQLPADALSLRNQQLSALIGTLQAECDQVLASNNELTLELVLLQQRRIALEILLERLTPLEA